MYPEKVPDPHQLLMLCIRLSAAISNLNRLESARNPYWELAERRYNESVADWWKDFLGMDPVADPRAVDERRFENLKPFSIGDKIVYKGLYSGTLVDSYNDEEGCWRVKWEDGQEFDHGFSERHMVHEWRMPSTKPVDIVTPEL